MLSCLGISVPFRQAEIDYVNNVLFLSMANEEIIRLHVSMNEVIVVQELKSLDHLVSNHKSSFYCEFALAEVEGVFQTRTEQVHDHGVIVALDTKPMDSRDSSC